MGKPTADQLPAVAATAAQLFTEAVDALVIKSLNLGGIDLSGIRHTGENQQVAALNNEDMVRGPAGRGEGIV